MLQAVMPMDFRILGGTLALLLLTTGGSAQVVLNEVLADNQTIITNGTDFPDYVELYNAHSQTIDLWGYSLTDNLNQPRKFVFPTNTLIAPGDYLLVWCDSQTNLPGLHTGFNLNAKGEEVGLFNSSSVLLSSVTFGLQVPDLALGRIPNATGTWALNVPTPGQSNVVQPLGNGSALKFNEWMANATPFPDWFEIYNATNLPVAVGGLVFTDLLVVPPPNRAVPPLSFVGGGGFVQIFADDLASDDADHVDFRLSSTSGETLTLYAADRSTVLAQVSFGPQTLNISQGCLPDGGTNLVFFPINEATPAASNLSAVTNVVVNELLSHTDDPLEDAVELFNPTAQAADLSYWWLSDNPDDPKRYRLPSNTIVPAGGFKVLYQYQFDSNGLGFAFASYRPGQVVLSSGDATGALTGKRLVQSFGPAAQGVAFGRFATSVGVDFVAMSRRTFGADSPTNLTEFRTGTGLSNAYPLVGPVIINEIMYHPPDINVFGTLLDNTNAEFIELFNAAETNTPLHDPLYPTNRWRFLDGVTFEFPPGLDMGGRSYLLVVGFHPTNTALLDSFRSNYNVPAGVPILGPYLGKLDNGGETIELAKPDTPQSPSGPDPGLVPYIRVDHIAYTDRLPWRDSADGSGHSLQRRSSTLYGNDPAHWLGAPPTAGRANAIERPLIESPARAANGEFRFHFTALAGIPYTVEWFANLEAGSPAGVSNFPSALSNRVVQFFHSGVPANDPTRYYRIRLPAQP